MSDRICYRYFHAWYVCSVTIVPWMYKCSIPAYAVCWFIDALWSLLTPSVPSLHGSSLPSPRPAHWFKSVPSCLWLVVNVFCCSKGLRRLVGYRPRLHMLCWVGVLWSVGFVWATVRLSCVDVAEKWKRVIKKRWKCSDQSQQLK